MSGARLPLGDGAGVATLPALAPRAPRSALTGGRLRVVTVMRAALLVLLSGNLVRLPGLTSGSREALLSMNDLAVLAVLGAGTFACMQARRFVLDSVARRALLFVLIGATSAALAVPRFGLSVSELAFSLAYLARWAMYFGVYVVAANCLTRDDAPRLFRALEGVILVFAAFGIVQAALLPGFAQLVYPESQLYVDWDPQGHRLVSTFLDPNFAGAFVCMGLLCTIARMTCGERVSGWRVAVLATALLLTASRSSILAACIGLVVIASALGVSRRVARVLVVLGALLLPTLPLLAQFAKRYGKLSVDASALERLVSWLRALRILADHWLIGVGFNTYGFAQRAYGYEAGRGAFGFSLDGGLLFVAVMTGVVGTAVFVGMMRAMTRRARTVWRSPRAPSVERAMAVAAVAATAALLVHSLFVNSLMLPFLMEPLWILWALPSAAARAERAEPSGAVA